MKARIVLAALGLFVATGLVSGAAFADDELVEKGEKVFKKCKACHTIEEGGKSKATGPNLWGVFGRTSGTLEGFKFSDAMKEAAIVWDETTIDAYLADPKGYVPNNKMAFTGLKKPEDRQAVIAYLKHEMTED